MLPTDEIYTTVTPLFDQNDIFTFDEGDFEGERSIIKTYNALLGSQRTKALQETHRLLGRLNCPFLARVNHTDEHDGRYRIVYQWLPVVPLSKIAQQREFTTLGSLIIVMGIAQALKHLHSLGWWHGNLCEQSIHLDRYQLRPVLFHLESLAPFKAQQDF